MKENNEENDEEFCKTFGNEPQDKEIKYSKGFLQFLDKYLSGEAYLGLSQTFNKELFYENS